MNFVARSVAVIRKVPSLAILITGLSAAALSIIGSFWTWPAVAGGVIAAVLFVAQYVTQGNVTVNFSLDDWNEVEEGSFEFSAGRNNGKGRNPKVAVYMPSLNGGHEEVLCDVRTLESGEVILGAGKPFNGEARIS